MNGHPDLDPGTSIGFEPAYRRKLISALYLLGPQSADVHVNNTAGVRHSTEEALHTLKSDGEYDRYV